MIVGNWMQTPPMTIGSDMLVAEAKRLISENSLHALPVVEKDGRMALLSSPCPAHRSTHSASAWLAPSTPPSTRSKGTAISACSTKEALSKCSVPEPAWPKCETLRLAAVAEIGGAAMGGGLVSRLRITASFAEVSHRQLRDISHTSTGAGLRFSRRRQRGQTRFAGNQSRPDPAGGTQRLTACAGRPWPSGLSSAPKFLTAPPLQVLVWCIGPYRARS